MKTAAAVYDRDGSISVRDMSIDGPGEGELLVRIDACGACSSEVMDWYMRAKAPVVLGHEPMGTVEECGPNVGGFGKGERVFVHHHAPCTACRRCRRGDYVQCETWRSGKLVPGGMSQYAIVPAGIVRSDVLALPDWLSDDAATFVEPLATVVKAVRRAGIKRGDRLLVIGLGVMGLLHVLLAEVHGAEVVIGCDPVASRREKASSLGAQHVFRPDDVKEMTFAATSGEGADVAIVGPGSTAAMDQAAACVARGGRIVLFAPLPPNERWPLPVNDFYFKDVQVITSYSAGPDDMREALRLLEGELPVEALVTHRFGLRDANDAYRLVRDAGEALKVIVYPNKS